MSRSKCNSAHAPGDGGWTSPVMLTVCLAAFAVLTMIFVPFPEIDLWAARLFYKGDNDFWLRKTVYTAIKNDYIRPFISYSAVLGLLVYLFRRLTDRPSQVKKLARWGFLLVCIALGTGVVVNAVFKDNFGRARPKQIVEFGGTKQFTPPLLPAQQCERNCSFVSGDASLGYVFLALALYARKRRKLWILTCVAAGLGIGMLRMMNGSHFLSDILYSGVFTCGTVLILYRWFVENHWGTDLYRLGRWATPLARSIRVLAPVIGKYRFLRAAVRFRRLPRFRRLRDLKGREPLPK